MKVETLKDVLEWTKSTHRNLSQCMTHCAEHHDSERARMLLEYLSEHENTLKAALQRFVDASSSKVLNTWCLEYLDRQPIVDHKNCEASFMGQDLSEIIETVVAQHHQIISLYKHLYSRAEIPSVLELTKQLANLEEHHAMQMVQASNCIQDI